MIPYSERMSSGSSLMVKRSATRSPSRIYTALVLWDTIKTKHAILANKSPTAKVLLFKNSQKCRAFCNKRLIEFSFDTKHKKCRLLRTIVPTPKRAPLAPVRGTVSEHLFKIIPIRLAAEQEILKSLNARIGPCAMLTAGGRPCRERHYGGARFPAVSSGCMILYSPFDCLSN